MSKSNFVKILALFLSLAGGISAQSVPSVGVWSRISAPAENSGGSVDFGFFSLDRLIPVPYSNPVFYSTRVSGLEAGSAYAITLPYASGVSVSTQRRADLNGSGGASLFMVATGPEVDIIATVSSAVVASELSLRGASVRSLSDASLSLIIPWLLLTLLIAFSVARTVFGITVSVRDKSRVDEAFLALAGISSLLLLFAMLRFVSVAFQTVFSAEFEFRLRAIGGIVFPVAAMGGIAATKPFKSAVLVFIGTAVLGAAALCAAVLPFIPSNLPMFGFNAFMVLAFAVVAAVSLAARRRFDAVLSFVAALGAALLCVSAGAVDPFLESIISTAAPLPLLIVSLRARPAELKIESAEPVLSDYVDQVSIALTRFVPKEFLAILDKSNAIDLKLGDHVKKDMTIFFSDIRSFTTLSEGLTPEENFKFINSYLARVVPVVTEYGGFVDKYIGDAIMALFPNETGADSAVRSAIEMQKRIVEYNGHRAKCGYRPLSMGIGLHTGTLMLGVVGVEDRMQSTVISDAVNLASRLESITKVFNVSLAISEETFKSLADPGAYMYRFIGKVRVKGKNDPVSVFEIFDGINEEIFEKKMKANRFFEQGMLAYYQKDFPGAMFYFRKVIEVLPEDGASAFYLDNCLAKARV